MTDTVDSAALAKLARLAVSEEEVAKLAQEIPAILAFVDTIQKAHTGSETTPPILRTVTRVDERPIEGGTHTEALLSAAPSREGDRIAVKQVISRRAAA